MAPRKSMNSGLNGGGAKALPFGFKSSPGPFWDGLGRQSGCGHFWGERSWIGVPIDV